MSMDARAAAVLADRVEAAAYADLYLSTPPALRARMGLAVESLAGATALICTALPVPMFNRVIGLGLERPASPADVDPLVDLYRRAGIASWWLHWSPFATPVGFPQALVERGFTEPVRRRWAKVLRSTGSPPQPVSSLTVEACTSTAQAEAAGQAIGAGFEMPPFVAEWIASVHGRARWRLFTARDHNTAAGGAALFIDGDACWLGISAVLPAYRRRGGQAMLIARRIAAAAGARWAVTETGEPVADDPNPSLANMKRSGFEVVASRLNLAAPVKAPAARRAPAPKPRTS
jgi:GNAT superfamily N-acetyltransferase